MKPFIWKYHAGKFETMRETKELGKKRGVTIDDIAGVGPLLSPKYNFEEGTKNWYVACWKTKEKV